jgi:thioredoxin 1
MPQTTPTTPATNAVTTHGVPGVTDASFADEVLASRLPVLVDFTSDWCPPCRMVAPVLEQIAAEHGEKLRIVSVNVDDNPETQAAYRVLATPTLILFQAGEPVKSLVGARPKHRLLQELADVL